MGIEKPVNKHAICQQSVTIISQTHDSWHKFQ
jgi:hypothetical protein